MNNFKIPFNKPRITGNELQYIEEAVNNGHISGDGIFTKKCQEFMENRYHTKKILLTTSCTSALEMAAILCNFSPGDEVIMPAFTFVSTANAFILNGAKIKFVDIREDTLNIDENLLEKAITKNTKAIVVVHYAGVSCEMDKIMQITKKYNLFVIEDAAQAIESEYKDKCTGTIGDFGCFSFHETKNITCGEGGAILINNDQFIERAEIIREKGTNRSKFFRGEIDKYTWVDTGSSYLPSEILSAFLYAQLENIEDITAKRLKIWQIYYESLEDLEKKGYIRRPIIPSECKHNGHLFYILLESLDVRSRLIYYLKNKGILSVFHCVPLHLSPMGVRLGLSSGDMNITENVSDTLLRLPLYYDISQDEQNLIINEIYNFFMK